MAFAKQTTDDYRVIDLTGGDYISEKGRYFLVDAAVSGVIVYVCPETGLDVSVTVPDNYIGTYYTNIVRQVGTTASNLIAIY